MINIHSFTFNPFEENTYILYDDTKECIIIDPGCYDEFEKEDLADFIKKQELTPVKLLNTHCHIDHVLGNSFIADKYGIELEINELELPILQSAPMAAQLYGIPNVEILPEPDKFLSEGDIVEFGNSKLDVLFTPGHSPGHIVLVSKEQKFVIAADVLFYGSIGRTDLPGGDHNTLIDSIKTKLFSLGDDFQVHPGHGPTTNIGFERENNPFLQG